MQPQPMFARVADVQTGSVHRRRFGVAVATASPYADSTRYVRVDCDRY